MEEKLVLPVLSDEEVRVLGSLIEKSRATPDYYPMTVNALRNACNQKSSRNPVVDYDEETVIRTLDNLRELGLVSKDPSGGRATKYRHTLGAVYPLDPSELSVMCLLMLRGPLTAGEINSNAGRLYDFDSIDEVSEKLEALMTSEPPFVRKLGKRPGQKENRFVQIFSPFDEEAFQETAVSSSRSSNSELIAELGELKERVVSLESEVEELKEMIKGLV